MADLLIPWPFSKVQMCEKTGGIINPRSASCFIVVFPTATPLLPQKGQFIVLTQTDEKQ